MIKLRVLLENLVLKLRAEELELFFSAQNPNISLTSSIRLETQSRERAHVADRIQELLERDEWAVHLASERQEREQQADTQN